MQLQAHPLSPPLPCPIVNDPDQKTHLCLQLALEKQHHDLHGPYWFHSQNKNLKISSKYREINMNFKCFCAMTIYCTMTIVLVPDKNVLKGFWRNKAVFNGLFSCWCHTSIPICQSPHYSNCTVTLHLFIWHTQETPSQHAFLDLTGKFASANIVSCQ